MLKFIVVLLLLSTPADQDLTFPLLPVPIVPVPTPKVEATKLTGDTLYVVMANTPHLLLASPLGLVTVTEEAGPLRLRGKFVDGSGKVETRTYKSKQIWIIEASGTGKVELLIFPAGATKASQVVRKPLDVYTDIAPIPPPPKTQAKHLTFIGANVVTASVINDAELRNYLKSIGVKVHVYEEDDPAIATFTKVIAAAGGTPCVVIQAADGKVLGQASITTSEAVKEILKARE